MSSLLKSFKLHMLGRIFTRQMNSVGGSASTIFSLSSGQGKCGVSVIRVSGPESRQALTAMVGADFAFKPRYALLRPLRHPKSQEVIDNGLVLWFPMPYSFTGEDSCEFQVHGSVAVVSAMLNALGQLPGLRPATPGEFTKRAFLNRKLDLIEVEGLADLIHAETETQRKQALLQSTGTLSRLYADWRERMIRCVAHLEAQIDFGEEEDIEEDASDLADKLNKVMLEIKSHLDDHRQGEMLRGGVRTAIIGAPNVGKSSLLNLICQRTVSIVTPIAGTTRDIIESTISFAGYPVIFADTAGLRKTSMDVIEQEGIIRAKKFLNGADLILLVMDVQHLAGKHIFTKESLERYTEEYLNELDLNMDDMKEKRVQLVANKLDLLSPVELEKLNSLNGILKVSCIDGNKMESFLDDFKTVLRDICGQPTAENPRITHERYRKMLQECINHLSIFLNEYSPDTYPDIAVSAAKLRNAVKCIESITGHVSSDDILDIVFSDFCIGK